MDTYFFDLAGESLEYAAQERNNRMISTWLVLFGLLLLAAPASAQAQFLWAKNADNTLTTTGYTGPPWAVTIPATINGLTVAGIGDDAFFFDSGVTNVTIPDGVTSIGDLAFYDCANLTNSARTPPPAIC